MHTLRSLLRLLIHIVLPSALVYVALTIVVPDYTITGAGLRLHPKKIVHKAQRRLTDLSPNTNAKAKPAVPDAKQPATATEKGAQGDLPNAVLDYVLPPGVREVVNKGPRFVAAPAQEAKPADMYRKDNEDLAVRDGKATETAIKGIQQEEPSKPKADKVARPKAEEAAKPKADEPAKPKTDEPAKPKAADEPEYSSYSYSSGSSDAAGPPKTGAAKEAVLPYRPKYPAHPLFQMCKMADFEWRKDEKLGKGGFGEVWRAVHRRTGVVVALKKIAARSIRKSPKHVENEETIHHSLLHTNIAKHYCTMADEAGNIFFVMEFVPNRNLAKMLDSLHPLPRARLQQIMAEMVVALEYLHAHCIVYRDLKAENVLLDAELHVKLIDFGLSVFDCDDKLRNVAGTLEYTAPEMAAHRPHGRAVDWYSLGILLYTVRTARLPLRRRDLNVSRRKMLKIIERGIDFKPTGDADVDDLVARLVHKDPQLRWGPTPETRQLLRAHAFFSGFDWATVETNAQCSPQSVSAAARMPPAPGKDAAAATVLPHL